MYKLTDMFELILLIYAILYLHLYTLNKSPAVFFKNKYYEKQQQEQQQINKMLLTLHIEVTSCYFCPHSRVERQNPKRLSSNKNFVISTTAVQQLKAE